MLFGVGDGERRGKGGNEKETLGNIRKKLFIL